MSRLHHYWRKVNKSLRTRGVLGTAVGTVRFALYKLAELGPSRRRGRKGEREFDRRHGVDTGGRIPLSELAVDDPAWLHGNGYQVTPVDAFEEIIGSLPVPPDGLTFIDFGAGKGRALLLAARHPFRAVIGVELAPELHAICEQNLARYRGEGQRCPEVRAYCGDASRYALPPVPSVLFLSNPFGPPVILKLLDNIRGSLARHPRDLFLAYYTPEHAALFDGSGCLVRVATGEEFVIWKSVSP
jgi:hypothetical protein